MKYNCILNDSSWILYFLTFSKKKAYQVIIYIYICVCVYIYVCIYVCIYIYIIYVCIYIYAFIYLYVYIPWASEFNPRILLQRAYQSCINKQILKSTKKYCKNCDELLQELQKKLFSKYSRSNQCFLFIRFVMENVLITNNHCLKNFIS